MFSPKPRAFQVEWSNRDFCKFEELNLFVKKLLQAEGTRLRAILILCDLATNYTSGTTAFFAVFGIDHFRVGYEAYPR